MTHSDVAPKPPATGELSAHELERFAAEIDALRERVMSEVGEQDARYLRKILRLQRSAEVAGRAALGLGFVPPLWLAGTGLLTLSKVLENMEIGHNVLHGQYDFMGDPALHGHNYEWDWSCPAEQWRHSHNYLHHTFTNIVGKDRDVGYGLLRMAEDQPWLPLTALQPLYGLGLMLAFEAGVAVHDLELNRTLTGRKPWREFTALAKPMAQKSAKQIGKDYVLFPMLAGPAAPLVFAGNLTANVARNAWAFSVIFCGHFPDGAKLYDEGVLEGESRGAWYLRQVRGSVNIEGPRWLHILTGHLSHQVEHHLFPDMPAPRYIEVADEVREICERYGVPYNAGPLPKQIRSAWRRILRFTLPGATDAEPTVKKALPTQSPARRLAGMLAPSGWSRLLRRAA